MYTHVYVYMCPTIYMGVYLNILHVFTCPGSHKDTEITVNPPI